MSGKQIFALCLSLLIFQEQAFAYLDAGTGSIILQAVLGGIAGAAVLLKMYWREFLSIFRKKEAEKGE